VSDALIGLQKYREFREQEANLTRVCRGCDKAGKTPLQPRLDSFLEVLTNDTNYYTAQLNLTVAQEK
jgi:multidrug efflux system outer membrane protein